MDRLLPIIFSRFCKSYEEKAIIQKQTAKELLSFSCNLDGLGIDLGSGTGFLSELLNTKNIISVDISKGMLKICKSKNKNVLLADIENLPIKTNSIDFAISNFSLHWTDLSKSLKEVNRILKDNGQFIFSIPIENSLEIIYEILKVKTFKFPSKYEILKKLEEYNFDILENFEKSYRLNFNSGIEILEHLHYTGVSINKQNSNFKEKRKIYLKFKNWKGENYVNYNTLFINCRKV